MENRIKLEIESIIRTHRAGEKIRSRKVCHRFNDHRFGLHLKVTSIGKTDLDAVKNFLILLRTNLDALSEMENTLDHIEKNIKSKNNILH